MPDTATRPTRTRASRAAAAKATPAKAAPAAAPTKADAPVTGADGTVESFVVALEAAGETKSYSVWTPPQGSGCVGKFYAPLGATAVKVAIKGASA